VLRIRDVYLGSDFFPSRIRTVSIPDPGSASKNLSILSPKKWFLSSRKYDLGCSSRIPDPDADFLPIPDPGSRGQKGTGSRIRIRNTGFPNPFKLQLNLQTKRGWEIWIYRVSRWTHPVKGDVVVPPTGGRSLDEYAEVKRTNTL
jgi:hypothetical protein